MSGELDFPETVTRSPNKLLVDYLVNCCLYYELSHTITSDFEFDELAHQLRDNWSFVDHPHKSLVSYEHLCETTSGYYIKYPTIFRSIAEEIKAGRMAA